MRRGRQANGDKLSVIILIVSLGNTTLLCGQKYYLPLTILMPHFNLNLGRLDPHKNLHPQN